jgi:hypothetical protein
LAGDRAREKWMELSKIMQGHAIMIWIIIDVNSTVILPGVTIGGNGVTDLK